MAKETFPKGTSVSKSKGLMTPSGVKPFVHVNRQGEFYRSYPKWKSKNPNTNHVYEFNGRLLPGHIIMEMIKNNMSPRTTRNNAGASTSGSSKKRKRSSPRPSTTSTPAPTRRVTRSMTRAQSTPSTSTASTARRPAQRRRVHRRKQSTPRRSYLN